MKKMTRNLGSIVVALSFVVTALPVAVSAAPANAIPLVSTASIEEDWVATVNTDGSNLNVRSGPGTSYSIIGKFANGTLVTYGYLDPISSKDWTYVTGIGIDGKKISGYVKNDYLIY